MLVRMSTSRTSVSVLLFAAAAHGADPAPPSNPIPFPHPVISEVLFDVPPGEAGDANKDGKRDANADEFIELFNPHAKPINLRGYRLVNRLSAGEKDPKKGLAFTFPACEVPPGGIVVLFNAQDSPVPAPVGNGSTAPPGPNPAFAGAQVFICKGGKSRAAGLNNSGDCVALEAPDGSTVDVVVWGTPNPPAPQNAIRNHTVKARPKGSVQRVSAEADMMPNIAIDGTPFSPGTIPGMKPDANPGPKVKGKPGANAGG